MRNFKRKWTLDRTKYMTAPEVTELRRTIESKAKEDLEHGRTTWPRFWMALDLALGAGLRVSEIATLRIGNLYLNEREPRLRVTGKGRKERDVFISVNLMKHLSDYLLWKRLMAEPMDPGGRCVGIQPPEALFDPDPSVRFQGVSAGGGFTELLFHTRLPALVWNLALPEHQESQARPEAARAQFHNHQHGLCRCDR